jgi:hypothetical protein
MKLRVLSCLIRGGAVEDDFKIFTVSSTLLSDARNNLFSVVVLLCVTFSHVCSCAWVGELSALRNGRKRELFQQRKETVQ